MSVEIEKIKFKIDLSGTYWGEKTPEYSISIDGNELARGFITKPAGVRESIEFYADIEEGDRQLEIRFLNKDSSTDVVKDKDGNVAQDILLNIEGIEIDDIELGHLRYTRSFYKLDKKQLYQGGIVSQLESCVNLGFNGTYTLKFQSPFYIWLLENL